MRRGTHEGGATPKVTPYRLDLALKVMQSADHVVWLARGKKGLFVFTPSEIGRLEDLDEHFYPSFGLDQIHDLMKLLGGTSYHFQTTLFELRGIMTDVLAARLRQGP
jgi:hypothetical protein